MGTKKQKIQKEDEGYRPGEKKDIKKSDNRRVRRQNKESGKDWRK